MITHERHYSFRQLEVIWHINYQMLRRWFLQRKDLPNVGNGKNWCPRIPESVEEDEYRKRMGKGRVA